MTQTAARTVAERPARLIRCEVLASWQGLDLFAGDGTWNLLPRTFSLAVVDGFLARVPDPPVATGLTLDQLDDFLSHPRPRAVKAV